MAKECDYCRLEPNGDIPEDTKDILLKDLDVMRRCIRMQIGNAGGDFGILVTDVWGKCILLNKNLKFKYCPKCGRELKRKI